MKHRQAQAIGFILETPPRWHSPRAEVLLVCETCVSRVVISNFQRDGIEDQRFVHGLLLHNWSGKA